MRIGQKHAYRHFVPMHAMCEPGGVEPDSGVLVSELAQARKDPPVAAGMCGNFKRKIKTDRPQLSRGKPGEQAPEDPHQHLMQKHRLGHRQVGEAQAQAHSAAFRVQLQQQIILQQLHGFGGALHGGLQILRAERGARDEGKAAGLERAREKAEAFIFALVYERVKQRYVLLACDP